MSAIWEVWNEYILVIMRFLHTMGISNTNFLAIIGMIITNVALLFVLLTLLTLIPILFRTIMKVVGLDKATNYQKYSREFFYNLGSDKEENIVFLFENKKRFTGVFLIYIQVFAYITIILLLLGVSITVAQLILHRLGIVSNVGVFLGNGVIGLITFSLCIFLIFKCRDFLSRLSSKTKRPLMRIRRERKRSK